MEGSDHGSGEQREDNLAWKVAMQQQMLEQQERQQQHMGGSSGPPGPHQQDEDLMMKVRQQQQLLDLEKQREAQQQMMEQQQLALLEAQRGNQEQRMMASGQGQPMTPAGMPAAPPVRSSGVSMVSVQQQPGPGLRPPGVVIPQGSGPRPLMATGPGQPTMSPQGGLGPHMQPGPPQVSHGGPRMGDQVPPPLPPTNNHPGMQQNQQPQQRLPPPPLMGMGSRPNREGGPLLTAPRPPSDGIMGPRLQGPPDLGMRGPPRDIDQRLPNDVDMRGPRDVDMRNQQGDVDMRRGPVDVDQRGPPADLGPRGRPPGDATPRGAPLDTDMRGEGNRPRMNKGPYNGPGITVGQQQRDHSMKPGSLVQSSAQGSKEMRLPQALEKMLEFKNQRAHEVGVDPDNLEKKDDGKESKGKEEGNNDKDDANEQDEYDEENDETISSERKNQTKESKNKRKKKKKKKARRNRFEIEKEKKKKKDKRTKAPEVLVEYVQEQLELDPSDPNYHTFAKIFETFKITEPEKPKEIKTEDVTEMKKEEPIKTKGILDDGEDDDDEDMKPEDDGPKISKKKLKKLTRLTVAQLKQLVTRPDVVEMHDVTARDPRLLVHLKATRNTVPVPRHWSYKRKYLQGKRGIEKAPFELPDFIKATGIEEMRAALQEKEDQKTLKSKMREKVRPKMGKIDIDYQKLHDAFFRFQTKPKMTIHGDLYYEAKEFETKLREKKPGNLSDDLKMALGMPIGSNSEKVPPPWLIAMQRYGPPPSYPNLKIAGLNAPIPEGCMFGYHAGGWGKPPVDENGKPLYGDVFGTQSGEFKNEVEEEEIDQGQWGELESESESESESEEEEEEEKDETGLITPAEGLMTPGGITSVPVGMETPDQIELRKKRIEDAMDQGGDTPALYQVLPEKRAAPVGGAMMGSAHVYDMSAVPKKPGDKTGAEAVEISLNPEELDLDTAAMQAKYDQTVREQQSQLEKEDLSDMVAAHAAKQKKRKKAQQDTGKGAKKYKDFKF
ncbi:splicing factor 3b subunit 2 [Plakobranchus ocellatus]|uniref:Splicing factor 3b subunit 2 n=1 Tax=Plakobranchus ocellatus TaxID=259542 RepID=A0AAV4DSI6_9GAST|nr:splicing factor 3b subunit 2 [Plakobranchus ocellatus]